MIKHIKCDIFKSGADVICHQVNCQGVMGSGIAKQVKEKYPWVYGTYRDFVFDKYGQKKNSIALLGRSLKVFINETTVIENLFGQDTYGRESKIYTDYSALETALRIVKLRSAGKTIAIPYLIGCARGGGDWNIVYKMIEDIFGDSDCDVLICEYNGG
jgi:O-acetyl-ADP-ribose deacetylase (regulator of RNase III)